MPTIRNRFYPLQDINDHEVLAVPAYSTLVTGLAGTLVKIVTGAANPQNSDGFSSSSVGYQYNSAGVFAYSNRYEVKMKVQPTASGDTAYQAIGLTEWSTLEFDENGNPLKYNDRRAREIGAVRSGEAVPIITKSTVLGIWGQYIDQSMGNVQAGNVLCVSRSGNGLLASVDPTDATKFNTGSSSFIYTPAHVVGKIYASLPTASSTGLANEFSAQGGYVLFGFNTNK